METAAARHSVTAESGAHRCKGRVEFGANRSQRDDNDDRDERSDKSVFNCCRARLIEDKRYHWIVTAAEQALGQLHQQPPLCIGYRGQNCTSATLPLPDYELL